jgi:hypothetical protein
MEVNGQLHAPADNPRERVPGTHWIGDLVGPRGGLDTVVKRKIPRKEQIVHIRKRKSHSNKLRKNKRKINTGLNAGDIC